ncbi:36956_t:CDS:2, partial [Gigaspora margarita]
IKIPKTICKMIEDESFWQDIKSLLKVLKQLVTGIALFESDIPQLAMFYEWYHKQLDSTENAIYEILEKRWILLAHLLDPNYCGRSLARNSTTIIESFIRKYYPKDSAIIWKQMIFYRTRSVAPQLTKLAIRILSIPCSSAAFEQNCNYKLAQPCEDFQKTTRILEYLNSVKLNNYEAKSARSLNESFNNTEDEINDYDMRMFLEDKIDSYDTETFLEDSDDENYANNNENSDFIVLESDSEDENKGRESNSNEIKIESDEENRVESEEENKSDEKENRSDKEESNEEKNRDSKEESNEKNRDEEIIHGYRQQ